jgi:hypothetical protein
VVHHAGKTKAHGIQGLMAKMVVGDGLPFALLTAFTLFKPRWRVEPNGSHPSTKKEPTR